MYALFSPEILQAGAVKGLNTTHLSCAALRLTVVRDDEKKDFRARGCDHNDL